MGYVFAKARIAAGVEIEMEDGENEYDDRFMCIETRSQISVEIWNVVDNMLKRDENRPNWRVRID
ncbi:hypothetical protein EDM56_27710 [Brevibacillus fluminis]|uniref:Uncharacterized protein n=1 Tax=Brevibacillus fluminis TaxID=511487 RepID=A0A3M8CY76_9BACL|nr:hypothetical protein [Brevibacillus fluminis]RNB80197.1 hypothetical protein EDM56_27710 [Brevibacillus fluminis]